MRRNDNSPKGQVDINSYLKRRETQKPKQLAGYSIRILNLTIDLSLFLIPVMLLTRYYLDFPVWQKSGQDWHWKIMLVIYLLTVFIYYFTFEKLIGKTIGQFITQTKVVSAVGSRITTKQIAKRSFLRLLPFDFATFLFEKHPIGLHDKYANTYVIRIK